MRLFPNVLTKLRSARAHAHAERIADQFNGTAVVTITHSDMWGPEKVAFATTLPDGVRIEVSWTSTLPLILSNSLGVVLPEGARADDETSFRTFNPSQIDGLFGLRHAYHKATGSDLPR